MPTATQDGGTSYRLAVRLRNAVVQLTSTGAVAKDFKFRDQIRDSAASVTRNLSEGFDRFEHPQFAYLANVAKGSLGETVENLQDGFQRGYFTKDDVDRLRKLAEEAKKKTVGLIHYLQSTPTPKRRPRRELTPVDPKEHEH